jgi:hypothetical protein
MSPGGLKLVENWNAAQISGSPPSRPCADKRQAPDIFQVPVPLPLIVSAGSGSKTTSA